jgi:hypothetical protein
MTKESDHPMPVVATNRRFSSAQSILLYALGLAAILIAGIASTPRLRDGTRAEASSRHFCEFDGQTYSTGLVMRQGSQWVRCIDSHWVAQDEAALNAEGRSRHADLNKNSN